MAEATAQKQGWNWLDGLWLIFLAGLALLPPIGEPHKQLILLAFAAFQLSEARVLGRWPRRGPWLAVAVKTGLAALLIGHTGEVAINSSYYPIFYVPIVTAAMMFGIWGTLGWTAAASAAYLSYLWPASRHYQLTADALDQLALRVFFFFLLATIINRFVLETRRQRDLYRATAESLARTNQQLQQAQADARRSERLAALGQLSAGLAHEIRNPLQVIKASAEMLEMRLGSSDGVTAELAGYISGEVNRVNLLVARFLDFARPMRLSLQPTPLIPLLERALHSAAERWPGNQVEVVREYDPQLPLLALDEIMAERIFTNLANNAFEAMAGTGVLRISARPEWREGHRGVAVAFRDSGPGVAPELREQVFNPFFTTKPTGVGLGLAIAAKIAEEHGGRLELGSSTESGASFEVFLPYGDNLDRG